LAASLSQTTLAATAPSNLIILLDLSMSTPIATQNFQRDAQPLIVSAIASLPMGSTVHMRTVSDDQEALLGMKYQVQTRYSPTGDTSSSLANKIPRMIAGLLNKALNNPQKYTHGQSALTSGIYDAAKYCTTSCTIMFFTDGMQNTRLGVHYPDDYDKPLVKINGLTLNNSNIIMYGVGQNVESELRIAVEQHWVKWLSDAGAKSVDMKRF
jgi:hypothetical protein